MYEHLSSKKNPTEKTQQGDQDMDIMIQESICNFFSEISLLIQDVYISMFKALFKRIFETNPDQITTECTQ